MDSRPRLVGVAVTLLISGCTSQTGPRTDFTGSAKAYSTEVQIGLEHEGFTYAVPLDVRWKDGGGTWHERGRPACLPPVFGEVGPVDFGAVAVETPDGYSFRQVVWISCDS